MACNAEYETLVATATILTNATPQAELVAVTGAIRDRMDALAVCVAGHAAAFPADGDSALRVQTAQVQIRAVADDAVRLAANQIPAGDRIITEGPATVFTTNVQHAVNSLQAAWFAGD